MRSLLILVLGFVLIISCKKDQTRNTIISYIDAHNEHNTVEELSHYHQEILFELKDTWTKSGIEEMRSLSIWDSVLNSNLQLEDIKISGDSAFCKIIENNDWFSAVGINDLIHDPTVFVIEDNKIKKIIAYPSRETGTKVHEVIGSIMQWSQKHQDSTIYELIPNGAFVYSAEAAHTWLDLIERWKSQ